MRKSLVMDECESCSPQIKCTVSDPPQMDECESCSPQIRTGKSCSTQMDVCESCSPQIKCAVSGSPQMDVCESCSPQIRPGKSCSPQMVVDESECSCLTPHEGKSAKKPILLMIIGAVILFIALIIEHFFQFAEYISVSIFILGYLLLGGEIVMKAVKNIVRGKIFDENFLMVIATLGAFAIGEYAEAVAVMLFFKVGEFIQGLAVRKSRKTITELMDIRPDYANLFIDNEIKRVAPDLIQPGDTILVKPGEKIPLDGVVISGESYLDTTALTGESIPRRVTESDAVLSGCINLNGVLTIEATQTFGQSTVSKILDLVENASNNKSPTESFITKFARYYTPFVVGLALLIAVIPPLAFGDAWFDWINRGLILLVISCPCALVISIPLSFFGGIGSASRRGVLVKGGNYLDALTDIDVVIFDKTGTLTKGVFKVTFISPTAGFSEDELLEAAAKAEAFSSHPIASAILSEFGKDIPIDSLTEYNEIAGHGVSVNANGKKIIAGNRTLMAALGVDAVGAVAVGSDAVGADADGADAVGADADGAGAVGADAVGADAVGAAAVGADAVGAAAGCRKTQCCAYVSCTFANADASGTEVHVAVDNVYMGCISISDEIKPDGRKAIEALKTTGVRKTVMLTGDNRHAAEKAAQELEIDEVYSGLLPQEKVEKMHLLSSLKRRNGKLVFVGDGINDAPVLAAADIGVAMGGLGSDAAIEAADIVLMTDEPSKLAEAINVARFTKKIVWQNIIFALSIKAIFLLLGTVGVATMWEAVFADVGVALLVVLNAIRIIRK